MEQQRPKVLFLFIGTFKNAPTDKDKIARFLLVTEDETKSGELPSDETRRRAFAKEIFGKNKYISLNPGSVYHVEADEANAQQIYTHSMRYGFAWRDEALRVQLRTEEAARQAEWDALRTLKNEDAMRDALRPITTAYAKAVGSQKAHILARAVAIITKG